MQSAKSDLTTAYNAAAGLAPAGDWTNMGGLTLTLGVYSFSSSLS